MKKGIRGLLLGAACMFALAGCGDTAESPMDKEEISAETLVQEAQSMLEAADSFAADFKAVVAMGEFGETMTEGTVAMVKAPLHAKVDTIISFGDQEQQYALYLEKAEDTVNQYMNYDGEWTEMTLTEETALVGVQIYNAIYNMETIFSAAENWAVEEDGNILKLTGAIPEDKVYDVEGYTRWFQMAGMSGLSEVYFEGVGDVPVTLTLDGKTGEPVSYSVDLTKALETVTNNVLKELNGGVAGNSIEVTEYNITSTVTQLGDVEAEPIPDAAKSDAINYEKEISMLEDAE